MQDFLFYVCLNCCSQLEPTFAFVPAATGDNKVLKKFLQLKQTHCNNKIKAPKTLLDQIILYFNQKKLSLPPHFSSAEDSGEPQFLW